MIVSLLQLMGFPMGKPVHSRAEEAPPAKPSKGRGGVAASTDHPQASSARRQEVKAKSGKVDKVKKAKVQPKAPTKALPKTATKAAAKPVAKKAAAPKAAAKVAAKPVAKPKVAVKPVAKSGTKVPAKATPKNTAPSKTVAKPAAKAAAKQVLAKAPTKSSAKPVAQPVVKKPAPKASPTPVAAPVLAKEKEKKAPPVTQPPAKPAPAPVVQAVAATPPKAGRPSSRLAQLTVPSIAQSVASTAAKASYTQTEPSPVIVPVYPSAVKKDPKLANNWKTKPAIELTDAELIAMPDSEYMNDVQLAAFRNKLVILKRDILSNAGETTEHLREDTSVVPDPADRATIEEEHALELRTRDRERKLLKKIEQSIVRIDAGDYGYCDETGEAIGVGRLLARPTATLSLEAQQRRELKQKMFGD
jgi:DnaK suppressor protein